MENLRTNLLAAGAALTILALAALEASVWLMALATAAAALAAAVTATRRVEEVSASKAIESLKAIRLREEQLTHTAHELRTPLTAVTTAIELLRDGYASSSEDWHQFLDQASVASRHMAFLINDIVDLAAIESGHLSLHLRHQRAQELIFDVAQVMQLTAQQRDVELRIEEPPENLIVATDRGRFLQVVFNLVANAIKFSEPGSTVHLVTRTDGDRIVFEVHDNGPGIAAEDQPRLFTRFGRLHDRNRPSIAGSGLGLHVCKMLVQHMGGQIGFRPASPGGSVFWFALPQPQKAAAQTPDPSLVALHKTASA